MAGFLGKARTVTGPDGRVWTVRREMLPRPPRFVGWKRKKKKWDTAEPGDWTHAIELLDASALGDGPAAVLGAIVFVILLGLAWFLVFPVALLVVDIVIFLAIAVGGIAVRVLFRRPWKIRATTGKPTTESHSWGVVGLRESSEAVDAVARVIAQGTRPDDIDLTPR